MKTNYNRTVQACFIGYVVQAIVNNFVPLLFLTFQGSYGISLQKITLLVTFNFGIQLLVDLASIGFVDRIGYRASMILTHAMAAAGPILLTVLPECLGDPFVGLLIAVMIYAIGGGLLEVLVSPVVEACPTDNKEKAMSLLHSFYCWGHVGVADIYKTKVCPLAKVMRRELKKRGVKKLKVVYSEEQPIRPIEDMAISCRSHCICPPGAAHKCTERRDIPGSVAFVPSVAGLIIAGEVIKDLTAEYRR